ncbi:hypothetical protein CHS0354_030952 [Potamilus streckersoni]|uniref:Uncharacterized protein n=1 Tax=Potamilus streckersoni TaxID=2493646 RepID=A0AAE0VMC4_9BIVA|nr:hypothetical protein CHS0354_030952 [Potamilus streckersoni]
MSPSLAGNSTGAKKAGIPDNQLNFALEPEAAAIYSKNMSMKKDGTSLEPGTQFILADLGGGTVDITVHAIDMSGNLIELHPPSGGPWGGTKVDAEFNTLLETIYGKSVISSFNKDNKDDVLYMMQDFENKKREFKAEDDEVTFRVPCTLIEALKSSGRTLEENVSGTIYEGKVKQKGDKMRIEGSIMAGLFYDVERNIIQLIRDVLTQHPKVNKILMVGGFSESNIIQQAVKKAFPQKINIPEQARLAVLKGAVMYGHNLSVIISRSSPYTYGISVAVPFEFSKHPESKKVYKVGSYKCESNFKVFIRAGEVVFPGKTTVRHVCNASSATSASVEIDRTKSNNPT